MELLTAEITDNILNLKSVLSQTEIKLFNEGHYNISMSPTFVGRKYSKYETDKSGAILDIVSNYFNHSLGQIRGGGRTRILVRTRMFISYYLRKYTKLSLKDIGHLINRDHTSVIYLISRYETEMIYTETQRHNYQINNLLIKFKAI